MQHGSGGATVYPVIEEDAIGGAVDLGAAGTGLGQPLVGDVQVVVGTHDEAKGVASARSPTPVTPDPRGDDVYDILDYPPDVKAHKEEYQRFRREIGESRWHFNVFGLRRMVQYSVIIPEDGPNAFLVLKCFQEMTEYHKEAQALICGSVLRATLQRRWIFPLADNLAFNDPYLTALTDALYGDERTAWSVDQGAVTVDSARCCRSAPLPDEFAARFCLAIAAAVLKAKPLWQTGHPGQMDILLDMPLAVLIALESSSTSRDDRGYFTAIYRKLVALIDKISGKIGAGATFFAESKEQFTQKYLGKFNAAEIKKYLLEKDGARVVEQHLDRLALYLDNPAAYGDMGLSKLASGFQVDLRSCRSARNRLLELLLAVLERPLAWHVSCLTEDHIKQLRQKSNKRAGFVWGVQILAIITLGLGAGYAAWQYSTSTPKMPLNCLDEHAGGTCTFDSMVDGVVKFVVDFYAMNIHTNTSIAMGEGTELYYDPSICWPDENNPFWDSIDSGIAVLKANQFRAPFNMLCDRQVNNQTIDGYSVSSATALATGNHTVCFNEMADGAVYCVAAANAVRRVAVSSLGGASGMIQMLPALIGVAVEGLGLDPISLAVGAAVCWGVGTVYQKGCTWWSGSSSRGRTAVAAREGDYNVA